MGSVNLVVIVESARTLIDKKGDDLTEFHLPSIIAVAAALGMLHSCLFFWEFGLNAMQL